jgi:ParB-like chromosome segregation protein Spo0J
MESTASVTKKTAQPARTTGARHINQSYELVAIDSVKPHPENPRRGDIAAIASSVEKNGFYGAVSVQRSTGRILSGNHRWQAAKNKGFTEIPVIWLDVNDKDALRILLADNRTSDLGTYEQEALANILLELRAAQELEGTGYAELDVGKLLKEMGDSIIEANAADEIEQANKPMGGLEYRVIVDCRDEMHQTELLDRFGVEGLTCRPLIS